MEEKGFFKRHSSLRSVFNSRGSNKLILGKLYLFLRTKTSWNLVKIKKYSPGFTLIELLVVIAMIGIVISFLILFLNPFKQIEKARDAQRQQNLKQINNALDTFYNDNNCYPSSLIFGQELNDPASGVVYMKQVPQDPNCPGDSCYTYVTDASSCPQWNVIFTKIYQSSVNSSTCALEPDCRPSNYDTSGYNYCALSGEVECAAISSITLPANAGAGTGGTGGGGGTGTPTPTPCSCASAQYDIRGGNCNIVANPPYNYCDDNCTIQCQ